MNADTWKDIVRKLASPRTCENAAHALCDGSDRYANIKKALLVCSSEEVIRNTTLAYRDWHAQPNCDTILKFFGAQAIPILVEACRDPSELVRLGVLDVLFEISHPEGLRLAEELSRCETSPDVKKLIDYILSHKGY